MDGNFLGVLRMGFYAPEVSEEEIKREKEKAKKLRRSEWWLRRINQGICFYCKKNVGREQLTMDHVVPLSRGGKTRKGNIVPACKECNSKKKYLLPIEWDAYLDRIQNRPTD